MNEIKNHFQQLIENKSWKILKRELSNLEPVQIAEIIESLDKDYKIFLFRLLSRELAKESFQHLSHEEQEDIIEGLASYANKLTGLLNDLDPDDRTAFFE
jgi:magnesium transporter